MPETMNTGTPAAAIESEDARSLDLYLGGFAANLETAQTLWRRYPNLVEAATMPKEFIAALLRNDGREPDYEMDYYDSELVKRGILPKPRSNAASTRSQE